ncbi:Uncharacterised protein [Legionella lansingensis]|uniref:Aminoglycoside phosphotransferase domain-containing protein n=1 Tax=Legionella lansingensis TaxID=45067 RepID=A0A0W0VZ65_9GAMM|nr:hypothetical protein [Legionella lansingensis]KTD25404.1 hypothetical protein Llan_0150 [Legionella lansingensis]SNV51374.1 Uncharacterised protein [Legionella lansingensis]
MNANKQIRLWEELKNKVEYLKDCASYHEQCSSIEAIETHMSWVFLTEQHAYKLKKPIHYAFLDLRRLEARYLNCQRELEINQELAPNTYLSVIPLCQDIHQQYSPINGYLNGEPVDWLLKMNKFPRDLTLEQVIKRKNTVLSKIEEAAKILVAFYQKALPARLNAQEYISKYKQYVINDFQTLSLPHYNLDEILIKSVYQTLLNTLSELSSCIEQRVYEGRIIECHGDLRPEHVCLTSPPIFVDRLEFSKELRTMDPVDELSYLALECELLGNAEIGAYFFETYQSITHDHPPQKLLSFYKSYRAFLRAKIAAWHLDDPRVTDPDKWLRKAKIYLEQAVLTLA